MSDYTKSPEFARLCAATCRRYAQANRDQINSGGPFGSPYMIEVYESTASRWDRIAKERQCHENTN